MHHMILQRILGEIKTNLSSILACASTYDNAAEDFMTLFVYLVEIMSASGVIS